MFGIPVKKSRERLDKSLLIDVPRYALGFLGISKDYRIQTQMSTPKSKA